MEQFRSWEQLTRVEQLRSEYSDFHKEVYGCRSYLPVDITEADAEAAMEQLGKFAKVEFARQAEQEQADIATFEALVTTTITNGAKTREAALRWIMDASGCNGDWEFLCYHHGLPYSYFRKAA